MSPEVLALRAERLRFRLRYHLGGDPRRLATLVEGLRREVPYHPLVLNIAAWETLPETALPPAETALSPAAEHFRAGRFEEALAAARALGSPAARLAQGDVALHLGRLDEAEGCYQDAARALGPLPPLLTRHGTVALRREDLDGAWAMAVEALVGNPLYGTARRMLVELAELRGGWLVPLPLRVTPGFSEAEVRAVRDHWHAEGLEEAAVHVHTLSVERAPDFRRWSLDHPQALRRFFDQGLRGDQMPVQL
ncbi:MAG: hypothetical protein H6739_25140 [Alphaproteobacteria bacterium]|nr:hypothetical protein [Alphaproteobacteria bacterium]